MFSQQGNNLVHAGPKTIAVQKESAVLQLPLAMQIPIQINANHVDMVKFPSVFDAGYSAVKKEVEELMKTASKKG